MEKALKADNEVIYINKDDDILEEVQLQRFLWEYKKALLKKEYMISHWKKKWLGFYQQQKTENQTSS